jgi:integrase
MKLTERSPTSWQIDFRLGTKRVVRRFKTREEAVDFAVEMTGKEPPETPERLRGMPVDGMPTSVAAHWDAIVAGVFHGKASTIALGMRKSMIETKHTELLSKPVRTIRPKDVRSWVRAETERTSPSSARAYLTAYRSVLRWCVVEELCPMNPADGVKLERRGERSRRHPFTDDEIEEIFEKSKEEPMVYRAWMLSLYAGFRLAEMTLTRWEDIDWEYRTVMVRGTKTDSSTAEIPLHPKLCAYLKDFRREETGPLIPRTAEWLTRRRWEMGLPGYHRGRHTIGSRLVQRGVDMSQVARMLRHSNPATTYMYYAQYAPKEMHDVISRI